MRPSARLHADQAARNIGKPAFNLPTGYSLPQNDGAPPVEADDVKRVLAEVDPDRGDDSSGLLMRCAHRMLHELASRLPATVQQISR